MLTKTIETGTSFDRHIDPSDLAAITAAFGGEVEVMMFVYDQMKNEGIRRDPDVAKIVSAEFCGQSGEDTFNYDLKVLADYYV